MMISGHQIAGRHKQGFTLLEVIMAIVLSLVAFWCMDAYARGLLAMKESESLITATNLAQEKIEEIRRLSYGSIDDEARADVAGFSGFERQVNVTQTSGSINSEYKTVDVIVYWQFPKGGEQSFTLSTYVADF